VLHLPDRGELQLVVHQILRSLKRQHEIFFVDLPEAAEREAIFRIHLQLRRQDPATADDRNIVRRDARNAAAVGIPEGRRRAAA
jgi:SpoVK/Ycf46/Vps4 family AAA+-type ATPase